MTPPACRNRTKWAIKLAAFAALHAAPAAALPTSGTQMQTTASASALPQITLHQTPTAGITPSMHDTDHLPWGNERTRLLQENKATELVELLEHYAADTETVSNPVWNALLQLHLGHAYLLVERREDARVRLQTANQLFTRYDAPPEIKASAAGSLAELYRQNGSSRLATNYYRQATQLAERGQSPEDAQLTVAYTCELAQAHLDWHQAQEARAQIELCIFASTRLYGGNSPQAEQARSLLAGLAIEEQREREEQRLRKNAPQAVQIVILPTVTHQVPPVYPALARRKLQEGELLVRAQIRDDGTLESVAVHRSSGIPALDEAALAAVRQWKFRAGQDSNGTPKPATLQIPFLFQLSPGAPLP